MIDKTSDKVSRIREGIAIFFIECIFFNNKFTTNNNIFIFRRDYRLHDNIGLTAALQKYDDVIPVFIGTPEQLTGANKYR